MATVVLAIVVLAYVSFFKFTDFRERGGGRGRELGRGGETETLICCPTYLYIHWLLLVCALTRD